MFGFRTQTKTLKMIRFDNFIVKDGDKNDSVSIKSIDINVKYMHIVGKEDKYFRISNFQGNCIQSENDSHF